MHLRTFVLFSVISLVLGQDRQITPKLNPNCEACSENTTLVYIKAEGSHDTIHQLWDFTRGTPTIIFAVAGVNSSLQVLWDNDRPVKFNMSENTSYSFAMAISDLIEYDDLEDLGHMDSRSPRRTYPLSLAWARQDSVLTDQEAALVMRANSFKRGRRWVNGTIDIKLDLIPYRDYAVQLPHLIHTANSTLIDVQLSNLTESRDYNASRFALRLVLVATDDWTGSMERGLKKSLDDEHTPGVFEIIEIKTPRCVSSGVGGYMQFRPVAYTQRERSVTTSTVVHATDFNSGFPKNTVTEWSFPAETALPFTALSRCFVKNNLGTFIFTNRGSDKYLVLIRTHLQEDSTLFRFYREHINVDLLVQDMVLSFGEPGDGYYRQHNYTAWSSTFGYGAPPVETFSVFVILVISIGLSVPVLLALSGVAYVLARRCRQNPPTRLNEE